MAKKLSAWKTKGMNRDLSVSAFNPEFAFENRNLRLSTNEGNTQMSWVNEKGTAEISLSIPIEGTPIGTAIINHQLVLFTSDNENENSSGNDRIYKLKYNSTKTGMECTLLYNKSLNFCILNPIETLISYESESIQKVYWVDGRNQPRLINIAGDSVLGRDPSYFDFVNTLKLKETVTVSKNFGGGGMFAPGVIQYALTYYNKNGQESNIFYTTPLQYISYADRGASPEDKVECTFTILVKDIDFNFDYMRIYSIQRTSINGTPICKRVQDIYIKDLEGQNSNQVSYVDTGNSGNSVDPTELLYKGGEAVVAGTLEQKDNTLFLGNLFVSKNKPTTSIELSSLSLGATRSFNIVKSSTGSYDYGNQLGAYIGDTNGNKLYSVPCGGFKRGETYRFGIQFQHETGKWSEPIYLDDWTVSGSPSYNSNASQVTVPIVTGSLGGDTVASLRNEGYRRVRALVVFPSAQDRNILCQGVANPTLYTVNNRQKNKNLLCQASWFFRPKFTGDSYIDNEGAVTPTNQAGETIIYANASLSGDSVCNPKTDLRRVEIQGAFELNNKFYVDNNYMTLNSPDIEFDDYISLLNWSGASIRKVNDAVFKNTMSDIDIQTETPTISNNGNGFVHRSFSKPDAYGIVSGLFYDDFVVEDWEEYQGEANYITDWKKESSSVKWMVYLWNKNGSLNNDITRPANRGVSSAVLKKKVISNLRYATTGAWSPGNGFSFEPKLFSGEEVSIVKLPKDSEDNSDIYMGNIDTLLSPDYFDGMYFAFNNGTHGLNIEKIVGDTDFNENTHWWKLFHPNPASGEGDPDKGGIYKYLDSTKWTRNEETDPSTIGNQYHDLLVKKEGVRMKYKSTPHLIFKVPSGLNLDSQENATLPIVEVLQTPVQPFGGKSDDAKRENNWVPCGESVPLIENSSVTIRWEYGDTYFQRWDCLKTYPFTKEDINQVVEIGSFMLESHVNMDGRYDRNRGQLSNLNVSPQNFNLINPVYSQTDNFFTYKILPEDAYKDKTYPNMVTWSKTKENGADVDLWTNVTLSSVLELDGDKGELNELIRFNDQLIAFQDTGISQVLYNENVQIQSTDGVPIEIANSGKVQGKRYLSNTVGCSNKWSMIQTPLGIYFMDNNEKAIYLFNGQLNNISVTYGFNSWSKDSIPSASTEWNPLFPLVSLKSDFTAFYDRLNQDVLFVNKDTALTFSEKFGTFTSFYDYGDTPFFENLDDTGIWIRRDGRLWMHRGSNNYCKFFGENKPYSMILVGNPEPQQDCIFTNLEFRACVDGEGMNGTPTVLNVFDGTFDNTFRFTAPQPVDNKYRPYFPFDYLETWNEYQHGLAYLKDRDGHDWFKHHTNDSIGTLKRKFRMWRCDIPRDNYAGSGNVFDSTFDKTFKGKKRKTRPMDRMRNPWLYIKLVKNLDNTGRSLPRAEIHDVVMTYYV